MKFVTDRSTIDGTIIVPGSKSHTIRAFYFGLLADGESTVVDPLMSQDANSSISVVQKFGAKINKIGTKYLVNGVNGKPQIPDDIIDVGNSGTTINIGISVASLVDGYTVFTGDHQIRNRPVQSLQSALNSLGADVICTKNNGKPPVIIKGRAKGGNAEINGISSQYLTSLLINAPLYENDTNITVKNLCELPYVDITLRWLDELGIKYNNDNYKFFNIPGNQKYKPFTKRIPGDFSSATFFIVLGAIPGNRMVLKNLDIKDPQGDKLVLDIVKEMGASVEIKDDEIIITGNKLKGIEIDMDSIPDALPAISALATQCEGTTIIRNVAHARLKETDRIRVMHDELKKLNAEISELEDGLVIKRSILTGGTINGHHDHRIVMSMAILGQVIREKLIIDTAEASAVTFPDFADFLRLSGGKIEILK